MEIKLYRNAAYVLATAIALACAFDLYIQHFQIAWHYFIFRPLTIFVLIYLGHQAFKNMRFSPIFYDLLSLTLFLHSFYGMIAIGPSYSFAFMQTFIVISIVSRTTIKRYFIIQIIGFILCMLGHYLTQQPKVLITGHPFKLVFASIAFMFQFISAFIYLFVTRYRDTINELNEKYALIGKQSSFLIHELKAPLMRSFSRTLDEKNPTTVSIHQDMARSLGLIESIEVLIFKPESLSKKFSSFKLKEIYHHIHEEFWDYTQSLNINLVFENEEISFFGDKNLIYHLYKNITLNAIEAIGYQSNSRPWIKFSGVHTGQEINIKITNSDSYMSPQAIRQAFKHSFTTKKEGGIRGLGLALVKDIVSAHKGRIQIFSQNGLTEFYINFPTENNRVENGRTR